MERLQAVTQWIERNRETVIRDLFTLVRVPSVSDPASDVKPFGKPCQDALDTMYGLAEGYGFSSEDFSRTVGRIRLSQPKDAEHAQTIGIWCHLDVVPVPNPQDWVYPPFEGIEVEGRYLIGRGIQDNKMPAVAAMHVFRCLKEMGIRLRKDWSLYLGTSEENGMDDVRWFVRNAPCPDLSLVPDTGFPVCIAQRGSQILTYHLPFPLEEGETLSFRCGSNVSVTPERVEARFASGRTLTTEGHGFHIIRADDENAVVRMLLCLAQALPQQSGRLQAAAQLLGDPASMGIAFEDEPSGPLYARPTEIEWRKGELLIHVFSVIPVTGNPDDLLERAQKKAAAYGMTCTRRSARAPVFFRKDHPLVRELTDVYREVTGDLSEPFVMTGGNYASLLPNALGFGPGMPGRLFPEHIFPQGHGDYHQCDESEDWEHIVRFMQVYAMAVLRLDALPESE